MPHNTPDPKDRTSEPGRRFYATFVHALVEAAGGRSVHDWQVDVLWNTMSPAERKDWNDKAEAASADKTEREVTIVPAPERPEVKPVVLRWHRGSTPQLIALDEAADFAGRDEHNTEEH